MTEDTRLMASLKKVKNIRQYVFSGRTRHDDAYAARGISVTRGQAGMYSKERHYMYCKNWGAGPTMKWCADMLICLSSIWRNTRTVSRKSDWLAQKLAQSENEAEKKRIA